MAIDLYHIFSGIGMGGCHIGDQHLIYYLVTFGVDDMPIIKVAVG
jgi:hypothetical protein